MAQSHPLEVVRFFADLSPAQLEVIERAGERRRYDAGEVIFAEGDDGTHVFCVLDGRVQITVALGSPHEQAPVHVSTPGSVFGEFALFEAEVRSATAAAEKPCEIFVVAAEALTAIFEAEPAVGHRTMANLCRILCERMRKTTNELRNSLMW